MFREMRRHSQQLSPEESREVLARCTSGVLAVSGDGGYPYAVPLSFAYREDKLYFHCAKTGHKLDALLRDNRAGFCVIDQDRIVSEEFTTYFRSVILFGRARILDDPDEKRAALMLIADKYSPNMPQESREEEINRLWDKVCMVEIAIEQMTGKQARELRRQRSGEGAAQ